MFEEYLKRRFEIMAKRGFLKNHGIVRNAIREDVLYFAIPALLVFTAGLAVSAWDGYDGLVGKIGELGRQPGSLDLLSVQNILGLALYVVGLTTAIVAQITLFRNYSGALIIREDHQLITHGIYRFTRHPVYLGVITAIIGIPVFISSLYGLLIILALIPIFLNRIRMEERLLTEEFGDAYRTYKETTSKLVPFIY
jgi:protein-S-isoprenylcysteine O-methyltransferase Ste14